MSKIEINIQVEPETENLKIVMDKNMVDKEEMVISFEHNGNVVLIDYDWMLNIIYRYNDTMKIVEMGKSEFVVVYDISREALTDQGNYIIGDCFIMKNDSGLKGIGKEDISKALIEFKSRLRCLNIGGLCLMGYELE